MRTVKVILILCITCLFVSLVWNFYVYKNLTKTQKQIKIMVKEKEEFKAKEEETTKDLTKYLEDLDKEKSIFVEEYQRWQKWNQEVVKYLN